MYQIKNQINKMPMSFSNLLEDIFNNGKSLTDEIWNESKLHVPVNILESESVYIISVIAPGIKKEDVKISLEKNVLSITYDQSELNTESNKKTLRCEYKLKPFKRSFTLNEKINTNEIEAKYLDGILDITLPKKETTEPEKQTITIA